MMNILKAAAGKSAKSSTVWLGIAWAVFSGMPEVLTQVVGWFGPVTPELTTKVVAISLAAARLRSIIGPLVAAKTIQAEAPK